MKLNEAQESLVAAGDSRGPRRLGMANTEMRRCRSIKRWWCVKATCSRALATGKLDALQKWTLVRR